MKHKLLEDAACCWCEKPSNTAQIKSLAVVALLISGTIHIYRTMSQINHDSA
jgi:hypothetical protein